MRIPDCPLESVPPGVLGVLWGPLGCYWGSLIPFGAKGSSEVLWVLGVPGYPLELGGTGGFPWVLQGAGGPWVPPGAESLRKPLDSEVYSLFMGAQWTWVSLWNAGCNGC